MRRPPRVPTRPALAVLGALALLAPISHADAQSGEYSCNPPIGGVQVIDPYDLNPVILNWRPGGSTSRTLTVKNQHYAPQSIVVTGAGAPWITWTAIPNEIAPGGTSDVLSVGIDIAQAPREEDGSPRNGAYSAMLRYQNSANPANTKCLKVQLNIDWPRLWHSAIDDSIQFTASTVSPATQAVALSVGNASYTPMEGMKVEIASVTTGPGSGSPPSWLKVLDATGNVPANGARQVSVLADPTGLPAGTYSRTLKISATHAMNGPKYVDVVLRVEGPKPVLGFGRSRVLLSTQVNALSARTEQLSVKEIHNGQFPGVTMRPVAYGPEGSGWLSATLVKVRGEGQAPLPPPITTAGSLTLRAMSRGLAAGYYTASLTIDAPHATSGTLPVALEVIDLAAAQGALTDPTRLPASERTRLDQLGNKDGVYNLGDYVALRTRLGLPN